MAGWTLCLLAPSSTSSRAGYTLCSLAPSSTLSSAGQTLCKLAPSSISSYNIWLVWKVLPPSAVANAGSRPPTHICCHQFMLTYIWTGNSQLPACHRSHLSPVSPASVPLLDPAMASSILPTSITSTQCSFPNEHPNNLPRRNSSLCIQNVFPLGLESPRRKDAIVFKPKPAGDPLPRGFSTGIRSLAVLTSVALRPRRLCIGTSRTSI